MKYSRKNPSKAYLDNIQHYKEMHKKGFSTSAGEQKLAKDAYDGKSTLPYVKIIKNIIDNNKCKSLLDYGCGKAKFYNQKFTTNKASYPKLKKYWNIKTLLYDPCFEKYNKFPKSKSDLTICIDVLEHIPQNDTDWVLEEILSLTNKITFINIACYPAMAILPNGQNAHINIKNAEWWQKKLIKYSKIFKKIKILALCDYRRKEGDIKWLSIDIRDHIKKYLN